MEKKLGERMAPNGTLKIGFANQQQNGHGNEKNRKELKDKIFKKQNSLLTDLFESHHIKTIYNIFVMFLIILFIQTAIEDIIKTGSLNLGLSLIKWNFGQMQFALTLWLLMLLSMQVLYFVFRFWAIQRGKFSPKVARAWDQICLIAYIAFEIGFLFIPAKQVYISKFPPTTAFAFLCEQVRFLMKSHAFIRSNVPRVLNKKYKNEEDTNTAWYPSYKTFNYFLFAPTLVYRDSYPRTDHINWQFVIIRLIEILAVIFYISFLFTHQMIPMYKDFGKEPIPLDQMMRMLFSSMMPSTITFLCGFYCLLHCWMNASAEVLRFADRGFYKDWWTSLHWAEYYSKWNCVVHDWLFAYIYKEFDGYLGPKFRSLSLFAVFLISAIFHEFILAFTFGFFYPFLFVVFGFFGVSLVFLPKKSGSNLLFWLFIYSGTGMVTSAYLIEWYARINCSPITNSDEGRNQLIR